VAFVAIVTAALTVRAPSDGVGLALLTIAIFAMSVFAVRPVSGQEHTFTATSFLGLGLAVTLGPIGCVGAALAEGVGCTLRFRSGAFRFFFNTTQLFLAGLAAWASYQALMRLPFGGALWFGVAGLGAGGSLAVVNFGLLAGILRIAVGKPFWASMRTELGVLPYHLAYGYAAVGFVALHDRFGSGGFSFSLAPVAALQGFLIVAAVRTRSHEAQRNELTDRLLEKSIQVERSYDATLVALTHALDARDKETEGHSRRVVEYTRLVAVQLDISGDELKLLCHGALLHDIGKIGVPDSILHKPEKLTEAEWQIMRRHPEVGAAMVEEVEYLAEARRIILHHHERWDGRGYPLGLRGAQISQGARAFAVADAVDAITQDRPYRRGRSFDEAREELILHRGTQFDPDAVDAFLALSEEDLFRIAAIRARVTVDLLADADGDRTLERPRLIRLAS
jgi:putative nucleotidyltransferase with HDIG domain